MDNARYGLLAEKLLRLPELQIDSQPEHDLKSNL